MRINTNTITGWKIASKTRPIKTKVTDSLVNVDSLIFDKLRLATLEADEPMQKGAIICLGEAGDVWQQTQEKLDKKYNLVGIDDNGWVIYEPKPDNEVNCFEVLNPATCPFTIIGQWGATVDGEKNVQKGVCGDFICQNRTDPTDVWVVKRGLFLNTYVIKS